MFTRPADDAECTADVIVISDASNAPVVTIKVSTVNGVPKMQVSSDLVDFGQVGMGETKEKNVNIVSTGAVSLVIPGFKLSGSEYYSLDVHGTEYPAATDGTGPGIEFEEPIVLPAGSATFVTLRFAPKDTEPATATLVLLSNDPGHPEGITIEILGNSTM